MMVEEHGKTKPDAKGEVLRGQEICEHGCSMQSLAMGESLLNVSRGLDCVSTREPLGVSVAVCAYNFPFMIPMWSLPICVTCGNTIILKPSGRTPSGCQRIAEMC